MVYVEYNNSKKIEIEKELEYEVSSSLGNSELLAFAPASEYYPSNSLIADGKTILDNDYLMSFNAIKTYIKKDYSFLYRNKYYKFNTEIKKGDKVYLNKGEQIDFEILGETTQQTYTGKNLFDYGTITSVSNGTNNNGVITSDTKTSGTLNLVVSFGNINISSGETIYFSIDMKLNSNSTGSAGNLNDNSNATTKILNPTLSETYQRYQSYFTYSANKTLNRLLIQASNLSGSFEVKNIMISKSSDASYEPYVGGEPIPNPDNPEPIINKTGTITETIQGEDYTFDLGDIELCKIGNYQDKIYKSNGTWYLHKEIGSKILKGTEYWVYTSNGNAYYTDIFQSTIVTPPNNDTLTGLYSNLFTETYRNNIVNVDYGISNATSKNITIKNKDITNNDVNAFKSWLSNNNTTVYYPLATPIDTEITDSNLLNQLENVYEVGDLVLEGYTNNKVILPVYDELQLNKSGSETSFSEVKADFGNRTIENLPMAYQEVRIWDGEIIGTQDLSNCELLFTGFLDKASVTQKHRKTDECDLELSLLSPMNLATKRYVTITGTYNIYDLFTRILNPLISDGFEIEKIDVNSSDITVKYYMETVETIMNDLSNKLNIFWVINEFKKISIYDINKLFNSSPKITIADELDGLYKIAPVIENTNYFNTVNIKNARVYSTEYNSNILDIMKLINDESLEFVNPIDFGVEGAERVCKNNGTSTCTILKIVNSSNNTLYNIKYENGSIVLPSGVVFSDEDTENATMVLQRDSFFSNLVTGIDWNGNTQTLKTIQSDTVLKYQLFKYYNSSEIEKCSDYITDSGIIEQTIDVNEAWFTYNEMVDYCSNLIIANSNIAGSVELAFDKKYDVNIGDKIRITMPEFLINGDFIITEKNETIEKEAEYDCQIKAQNNQLLYNYIDIFRKQLSEEDEEKYNNVNIVNYVDDKITEKHIQTEV